MGNTIYIKRLASVLPEKDGYYTTNEGKRYFHAVLQKWANTNKYIWPQDIEYWFEEHTQPPPISPKGMTLEEAKNDMAKKMGYESFAEMDEDYGLTNNYDLLMSCFDQAADLYLASNTLKLKEENEELKNKLKTEEEFSLLNSSVMGDSIGERGLKIFALEQQVQTLKEQNENLKRKLKASLGAI